MDLIVCSISPRFLDPCLVSLLWFARLKSFLDTASTQHTMKEKNMYKLTAACKKLTMVDEHYVDHVRPLAARLMDPKLFGDNMFEPFSGKYGVSI
mmetsp:Transcript_27538/g.51183  ORF Transcript_27538/g.51183 Transcript_27538/m.51183 type:complete len:95 (-) Transcript_27538:1661-1945(-)